MMKLFKNIILAVAALASPLTLTSCIGDSDDNSVEQTIVALYKSDGTFEQYGGTILVPKQSIVTTPGMYTFEVRYNPGDATDSGSMPIEVISSLTSIGNDNLVSSPTEPVPNIPMYSLNYHIGNDNLVSSPTEPVPNIPMYSLNYQSNQGSVAPYKFNNDYLIVPAMFWVENVSSSEIQAEIKKHTFALTYLLGDDSNIKVSESGVLDLYLTDNVSDASTTRARFTSNFEAFYIGKLVKLYNAQYPDNGLQKIRIHAYVNGNECNMEGTATKAEYYDVQYAVTGK